MTAIGEIEFVNAIDKRYQVVDSEHNKPTYSLIKGVKSVDFRNIPSSQGTSTTSTEYLIQPQLNNFVSTMLYEEVQISFSFSFTTSNTAPATTAPFPEGSLCTCFMPLSQASNTLTVALNGTPFKVTNSEILRMVMSFNKTPELNGRDLMNASQLDTFTDNLPYSSDADTFATLAYSKQAGSIQSNKSNYFNSTYGSDSRFGSVTWAIDNTPIATNTANQIRVVTITIREPLFSGITSLCSQDESSWVGLSSLQITRTFVGNVVARMIQYTNMQPGLTLNAEPSWTFATIPKLYYKLTLLPDDTKIPESTWYQGYSYDNMSIQASSVDAAGVPPGADVTINSQTINLSHVPRCIYVAVMVPLTSKTVLPNAQLLTDAPGFQIKGLQVTYGGPGQFASLSSSFDVYKEFCLSENYNKTWTECGYAYYTGTGIPGVGNPAKIPYAQMGLYGMVLRIDSSKFQIDWSKYSVGCAFNASLSIQVTATNLSSVARTPSLFIVPVNDIVYQITNNACFASKGLLTESEVAQIRKMKPVIAQSNRMIGGNIFNSIWNGLKTGANWVYDHRDAIVPIVKGVATIAGLGKDKASQAKNALVKRMKGRGQYDTDDDELTDEELDLYNKKGGSVLTKSEMKHKLKFIN